MGLDYKSPGNPLFVKGNRLSANRHNKEPKKLQVKKRLLGKWRVHPVDRMVEIANFIKATNPEFAAKIWMRLLDSCELEENKKRTSMPPPIVVEEVGAEKDPLQLLEEMEKNDDFTPKGSTSGVADGSPQIQAETCTEADLREHKEE